MEDEVMTKATAQHEWTPLFKFVTDRYQGRPTRLGIFDGGNDYWLESGLPFTGIDVDTHEGQLIVELVLGDFTHITKNVKSVKFVLSHTGEEDGFDIEDLDGRATVLRFEVRR
jgi:hypothetical protein